MGATNGETSSDAQAQKAWDSQPPPADDHQALLHEDVEMDEMHPPPAYSADSGPNFASGHAPNQAATVDLSKIGPPGSIRGIYQASNLFLVSQWVMSICLLGSSSVVLHRRTDLASITPFAAIAVTAACVLVAWSPFRLRYKSASIETPRPPVSYTVGMGVALVLWAAGVGCGVAGTVLAAPYRKEIDEASRNPKPCGGRHQRSCFEYTERAMEYTRSIITLSFAATGLVLAVGQAYKLTKLWRLEFPKHVIRGDFTSVPTVKKVSFRDAWKEGWRRGRESH